ncbi:DUF535 family protein [Pelosinus sp. UFO1]|uniref:VirK/YbjX family protein n=1 Tax=Pelosinus sp. UFO1 TaxID=484770 RepID=UPI0004D1A3F0|nr:DUF535 family protein [Pelosinus sp. UFO1]AIF53141.1 protein of unknown function DUF535 [Pelosinus sp. UFO1]
MQVYAQLGAKIYNNNTFSDYRRTVVFIVRSLLNHKQMQDIRSFFQLNSMRRDIITINPFIFEQVTRCIFYRHSTFSERRALIKEHFFFLEDKFTYAALRHLYLGEGITLWRDNYRDETLSLKLQFNDWHKKEGLMGITLKIGERMIYQIIFWVALDESGERGLRIGAIQGSTGGLDIARDLTKHFYGLRPKNFIIQALRVVVGQIGIDRIYAVSNYGFYANNHIRIDRKLKTSLDNFWEEIGGGKCGDPRFYEIPITEPRKRLEEVKRHKRNLYRKRFAMLDTIKEMIIKSLEPHLIQY